MKKMKVIFACLIFIFGSVGCSNKTDDLNLIYEETISPNEEYVTEEENIVYYTTEIYQNDKNMITVNATSNSDFFEPIQYTIDHDEPITKDNIDIQWTTLMGNPNATKDDQLCIAYISISEDGEILDERKISFINGGIEAIEESLDK